MPTRKTNIDRVAELAQRPPTLSGRGFSEMGLASELLPLHIEMRHTFIVLGLQDGVIVCVAEQIRFYDLVQSTRAASKHG